MSGGHNFSIVVGMFLWALSPTTALAQGSVPVSADEPQPAEAGKAADGDADALFQRGVELMKADRCSDAIPAFLQSNSLDPSASTLVNLGTCYARLGRKATAWKTYQRAAVMAQAERDDAVRERALQAMAILGPALTKIQIVMPSNSPALSLRLNGEPLVNYDGLPIPLDPGESVIEAAAPGREPWRHAVTANDLGATLVIQVPDLAPAPSRVLPAPLEGKNSPNLRMPGAIIAGVGLASILVGSIFGLSAAQSYDDSHAYCSGNRCTPPGIDLRDRASTKAAVSTWTVSLGLVATATGAVMWLVSPAQSKHQHANLGMNPLSVPSADGTFMMLINERH
jgi:hypothetical protein